MSLKSVTNPDHVFIWQTAARFKICISLFYFIVYYGLKLRHCINKTDQLEVRATDSVLCGKLALNLSKSLKILWHSVKELN